MSVFWHATYEVARKEFLQHLRTKRLLIIGGLFAASLFLLTVLVAPQFIEGSEFQDAPREHMVLLFYFSTFFVGGYFFIQLLAIVLTADAVCSEWAHRTVFLLLSKPVPRGAFVTGKFLGSLFTVASTLVVLFSLNYLVLQPLLSGTPSAEDVARFFAALGVLVLGAAAFTSITLFLSTLSRSTVLSLLFALGLWIIVFPIVGQIGLFTTLGDDDFNGDLDDPQIDWSRYLNPGSAMSIAGRVLVPSEADRGIFDFFSMTPAHDTWALFSLVMYTGVFFALSWVVVERRDFE